MDEIRQPGKWLDAEMSEQETADFMKITAIMSELDGEQDQEKILNSTAPYMNSFMHLMYLIIRGKLGLEATDDGVKYKDQDDLYFDLVKYVIDFVVLQQDAFDEIDAVTSLERQEAILNIVTGICETNFEFDNFLEVTDYFKKMINLCKQMNYSQYKSEQYEDYVRQIKDMLTQK